jgi:uncharacterized protein YciI
MLAESTPEEDAVIDAHFAYLEKLVAKGVVLLAGRTETQGSSSLGIVIYKAANEDKAREIMNNDPAIKSGVMRAEFHNFRLALLNTTDPFVGEQA